MKKHEQLTSGFRSIRWIKPWATAKVLMLLVMLMVSVQGAWAQFTVGDITYLTNSSPNSVHITNVSDDATEIQIPATVKRGNTEYQVTYISSTLKFSEKPNLKKVTFLPDENGQYYFTQLSAFVFGEDPYIEVIELPNSITSIGGGWYGAFQNCSNLKRLVLPSQLESIGESMLAGCTSLTTIDIPESVTSIGNSAFSGCTKLENITLPKGLTSLGESAFRDCESLRSIEIPGGVSELLLHTFWNCYSLTNLTLNEGLTRVAHDTFYGVKVTSLHIPASLIEIGDGAFNGFQATLSSITVAEGNPVYSSPNNCNALMCDYNLILGCKNTVVPDGAYIRLNAFNDCTGLTTLRLSKSVAMQYMAFKNCTNLTSIYCTGNTPQNYSFDSMGMGLVFFGTPCKNVTVYVPYQSLQEFRNDGRFNIFKSVEADPETIRKYYISDLGMCYYQSTSHLDNELGVVGTTTNDYIYLMYGKSASMSRAITGVRLVKTADRSGLKDQLTIDGKTYQRGEGPVIYDDHQSGTRYSYQVYYTTDGNEVEGMPLLTGLEIVSNYQEPLDDPNFVPAVVVDKDGNVQSTIKNADWNELDERAGHYYRYVKPRYEVYSVANNEIHYTTSDNQPIAFADGAFGADNKVLSNTFDEGEGIITFSEAVTGELAAAFAGNDKLTLVMLPTGINRIGAGAFEGCTALTGVLSYADLYFIGNDAFKGCTSLTKLSLGEWGVRAVGVSAFEGCTGIAGALKIPAKLSLIGDNAFKGCSGISSVTFGSGIVSIGASAFEDCDTLNAINIPDGSSLRNIGAKAFKNTLLEEVDLSTQDKLDAVGVEAFAACAKLTNLKLHHLAEIPSGMFAGPVAKYFEVGDFTGTMADIADDAFNKSVVKNILLDNAVNVTEIPADKFFDYNELNEINFSTMRNLTTIGDRAFRNTKLNSVDLTSNNKITEIGEYAFADNPNLSKIELPFGVTEVKAYTFYNCSNLETLDLRDNIASVGISAFEGCSKLKTLMLNKGLKSIGKSAFLNSASTLEVITNLTYEGSYATDTNCFSDAVYESGTLRKVGTTVDNEKIYSQSPWNKFKNVQTDGSFYVEYDGSTYRIYEESYPMPDGRKLTGAELISSSNGQIASEVEGYPVIAIAAGSLNLIGNEHVKIPGCVVVMSENLAVDNDKLRDMEFCAGDEPLYMANSLNAPKMGWLTVDRNIICQNHGPFEDMKTNNDGVVLTIGENVDSVQNYFCKNSSVYTVKFLSKKRFTFGDEAFRGCNIKYVDVITTNESQGMAQDFTPYCLFESSAYRNAMFTIYGPKEQEYTLSDPWINFYTPDVTEFDFSDGCRYKIYPRGSYSYKIKDDFGVSNLTGAVLIGPASFMEGKYDQGNPSIPEKVNGFPVIAIKEKAFQGHSEMKHLYLPGTLRMIENNAVEKMEHLKTVSFGNQKFRRGDKCYVGYSVYTIVDEEAFYECDELEEVTIGCDLDWCEDEDEPFEDRDNLKIIRVAEGCEWIGKDADPDDDEVRLFNDCDAIEEIIIEDSDTPLNIYTDAFSRGSLIYLKTVKKLYVGRNLTSHSSKPLFDRLGDEDATGTVLYLGDKVTRVPKDAFECDFDLIHYSPNLVEIEAYAFADCNFKRSEGLCPKLEKVGLNANVKGNPWFNPDNIYDSSLTEIEGECCSADFVLYLPPSVKTLRRLAINNLTIYLYKDINDGLVLDDFWHWYNTLDEDQYYDASSNVIHLYCIHSGIDPDDNMFVGTVSTLTTLGIVETVAKPTIYTDIHLPESKKGDELQTDGLYHEVCAGCGNDDRSSKTGNYYIHDWNGADDIMIHKDGSSYTYAGPLAIDDSKPFQNPVSFSAESVSYNRTVTGGCVATFVLPFASNASEVNGTVYKFREFNEKENKFCFDEQKGALDANTPYLVVLKEDATQLLNSVNATTLSATVDSNLSPLACNVTKGTAEHVGSFVQQSLKDGDNGKSYFDYNSTDGAYVKMDTATLNPFRTMLALPQGSQANSITLQLGSYGLVNIVNVDADLLDGDGSPMYDLNGRIVTTPVRGQVYIQDGRKIVKK